MRPSPEQQKITQLLESASAGDTDAFSALLPLLYTELHELAHRQRRRQKSPETLNTTALLHEAYEKLASAKSDVADRSHFFRIAARAMRQILVDYARKRLAAKRGGGQHDEPFEEGVFAVEKKSEEILALDEALETLKEMSPRQADVVTLRYYAGFTLPETAELLGISSATTWREWTAARAWLQIQLGSDTPTAP